MIVERTAGSERLAIERQGRARYTAPMEPGTR